MGHPYPGMRYMDAPAPQGHGLCSDNECPCPGDGARIPRGKGYLYVSPECVDFRGDALSVAEVQAKTNRMSQQLNSFIIFDQSVCTPTLVCEQGARRRGLNLEVAAEDAAYWWRTGKAPLRVTPRAGEEYSNTSPGPGAASPGVAAGEGASGCAVLLAAGAALAGGMAVVLALCL